MSKVVNLTERAARHRAAKLARSARAIAEATGLELAEAGRIAESAEANSAFNRAMSRARSSALRRALAEGQAQIAGNEPMDGGSSLKASLAFFLRNI